MKKTNIRNENGSISMFVILSVLFLIFVLVGLYANYANKLKAQQEQIGKIKESYGEYASIEGMDKLYIKQTQPEEDTEGDTTEKNEVLLPTGYQQVEYIETTGTQYIDTGYIPNSNTTIEMKASNTSTTNACLYCARGTSGYQDKTYTAFLINGTSLRVDYYNKAYDNIMTAASDTAYEYKQSKNLVYVNGELKKTLPQSEFSSQYNMYLLASHQGGSSITNIGNVKLYYCQIWDGEVLVRDFIPCYKKSDNVVGLYDTVNDVFYTSKSTENFEKGQDINDNELPAVAGTTPWLPTGFVQRKSTSLETGLTIMNVKNGTPGLQNYVWIEVPNNVKQTITVNSTQKTISLTEATTNDEIELILKAYAGDYTKGSSTQASSTTQTYDWKDEWYSGCGMTNNEYQNAYSNMLKSIQKYGGFWLAQYEAGISYEQGYRTGHTDEISIVKANYAKNQYPYNYLTSSEAQKIASSDSVEGKHISSLPFGIQYDLVCKFLDVKTDLEYADIATNSIWGNYDNLLWQSSDSSKYYQYNTADETINFTEGSFNKDSTTQVVLLTTGAINEISTSDGNQYITNPMNIYDLPGNISEWTLEYSNVSDTPSIRRGGNYHNLSSDFPCAHKLAKGTTDYENYTGFRSVLYTVEDTETTILPSEYQQVEYIESTGTQYIDTGVVCNENLKIEVEYKISSFEENRSYVFGVYGANDSYRVQYSHTSVIFAGFGNMYNSNITAPTEDKKYNLIMDNGKFTLDGEVIYDATSAGGKYSSTNNATIVLFACNGNGSIGNYGSNRIYSCKMSVGETEVRNLVPCYRKSDNVAGMYDLVNDVFYTNSGTGSFEVGYDVEALPSAYQQVEYLESSGTQYIDTGVVPTDEVGCYVDFEPLSGGTIFGAITKLSEGYYGINIYSNAKQFEVYWQTSIGKYSSVEYNTRYVIDFNYMNSKKFKLDDSEICSLTETDNITTNNIHLFKLNEGTTTFTQYISAKVYGMKITEGENIIRNLVPCYRKSDNVAGMYDTVNDVFYTNSGTGTFSYE